MTRKLFVLAAALPLLAGCPAPDTTPPWTAERIAVRTSTTPVAVAVADMDRDGDLDVISAWRGSAATTQPVSGAVAGGIAIHFQRTPTNWDTVVIDSGSKYANVNAVALGDMNEDGRIDIVVAAMDRIIYLRAPLLPELAGQWVAYEPSVAIGTDFTAWYDVAVAQIDGLHGPDIVASLGRTTGGRICWFQAPLNPDSPDNWERIDIDSSNRAGADSVLVADVDLDGRLDVISTAPGQNTNGVSWYKHPLAPASGTWTRHAMSNFDGATRMAYGDLDGDGKPDLALISPKNNVAAAAWLPQPADVTARWPGFVLTDFSTSSDKRIPTDVAIADVNGDGQNDVIIATADPSGVYWYTPGEDNTRLWTQTRIITYTAAAPGLIAVADIDADGRTDVVVPIDDDTNSRDRIEWLVNPPAATEPAP